MQRKTVARIGVTLALVTGAGLFAGWYSGRLFTNPSIVGGEELAIPASSVQTIATGLDEPWGLAFLPGGSALITERRTGEIKMIGKDRQPRTLQRVAQVVANGDGGLLGIAVSPDYTRDRWAFIYYTTARDNRVARLHLGEEPEPILTGIPKSTSNNGGRIAFGPDRMLYIGTGDAGDRGKAQSMNYLGGKILRVTTDGEPAPGNPFVGSRVYSLGHRSVTGLSWDSAGHLYEAEPGQNRYDELNLIQPGGDYGWPLTEGIGSDKGLLNPIATWSPADASPAGMAIIDDNIYLACLRGDRIYQVSLTGTAPKTLLTKQYGHLRAVAAAPDGSLWILTANDSGNILVRLLLDVPAL